MWSWEYYWIMRLHKWVSPWSYTKLTIDVISIWLVHYDHENPCEPSVAWGWKFMIHLTQYAIARRTYPQRLWEQEVIRQWTIITIWSTSTSHSFLQASASCRILVWQITGFSVARISFTKTTWRWHSLEEVESSSGVPIGSQEECQ